MKSKKQKADILESISPMIDLPPDSSGKGYAGFTIRFCDGAIKNIIHPYQKENKARVLADINRLRQSYIPEQSLPSGDQEENQPKTTYKRMKRR